MASRLFSRSVFAGTTAVICLAIFLAYKILTADPAGFCAAKQRYISDQEFIAIAVTLRELDWKKRGGREKFVYSGRDFDLKNLNCCRVIREETESIFNRIFGVQHVSVELNNETSTRDIRGANLNDRIFFDVCGKQKGRIEYNWQAV